MKTNNKVYSNISTNVRSFGVKQQIKRFSINSMGFLFPNKTKSLVKHLFFKPSRRKPSEQEQKWLSYAKNFQIQVGGKVIQCWKWGDGPQILSLHGWNGIGVNLYPVFAPLLLKGYSVVAFDAPGHGMSEGELTNYFEITDTARILVKKLGKQTLSGMIAHSVGGAAAINCLSKEKLAVKTVLIAPALKLKELLFNTFIQNGIPEWLYHSIISDIEEEYRYNFEDDNPYILLENLNSDVMILHDRNDKMIPFAVARTISKEHSNIILHTTEGLGHKYIIKARQTADTVLNYMTTSASGYELNKIPA